jgi:hypothetical protein
MVTVIIATASRTPTNVVNVLFGIISFTKAAYLPLHRRSAARGPFILPTPLADRVIGLSPQRGNKLALPK